jgi:acetyltransferase-like isoleucine patch superfamily enzyme
MFGVKRALLRWCGLKIGNDVRVASSAKFLSNGSINIGDRTWIGHDTMIVGGDAPIQIGADVDIAPRVLIVSGSHVPQPGMHKAAGPGFSLPIIIGDGCWIGANATVLGGTEIGHSTIVAAGSLVRGKLGSGLTYAGVPARSAGEV